MGKMTYKEFEKEVNMMGLKVGGDKYATVKWGGAILAGVSKECTHVLDLDWSTFQAALSEEERAELASLCWRLASTPLKDREEQKKYYLKVKPRFRPWFVDEHDYLKKSRLCGTCWTSDNEDNNFQQTIFTETEIEELRKNNDLALFEKVEVADEELD